MGKYEYHVVAGSSDLLEGATLRVKLSGLPQILLCRVDDSIYAVSNICTHAYAQLDRGGLRGFRITCPAHAGTFDIRDGAALCDPVKQALETYPTRLVGNNIEVAIPLGEDK